MKAILIIFLFLLIALACTMANPPRQPRPTMTPNPSKIAEMLTYQALPTLSDDEIRQTQCAVLETATAIAPYISLTHDMRIATVTSSFATLEALGIDAFAATATSLVANATANANRTPTPFLTNTSRAYTDWPVTRFAYREGIMENWLKNPDILEVNRPWDVYCTYCQIRSTYSHEIIIYKHDEVLDEETLYIILEDAVSRLPTYPPFNPEIYETIIVENMETTPNDFGDYGAFTYTNAIAAYESGLRGADLAEALGVSVP
jgi:hypothetical protein